MKVKFIAVALSVTLLASGASAQGVNLSGPWQCVALCLGPPGGIDLAASRSEPTPYAARADPVVPHADLQRNRSERRRPRAFLQRHDGERHEERIGRTV